MENIEIILKIFRLYKLNIYLNKFNIFILAKIQFYEFKYININYIFVYLNFCPVLIIE